ncbi:TetR/AcrR family transcriptional regulator [Paenibacillus sacheonensis]|uniref:TetR family transcriptional regulator n=1 Tax=Paenibacillus sacheonensis TaxID=742054 RepID=A0A7X4YS69_9BACL|nr:TetR/AcrR family transcriptional regulator [Paenibacillus sacheonensis]MBM7566405.1 AcrR family transcriptional regulator [Paenibacillus sacheonensis]NBC70604.1 TetR family transcriptional regulator [Paenibacillus sacheonensis]
MARVSKKPEVRRKEIIDAALSLFSEKGYEQTAVSDIVKKLGVAQGTFYYHFKTKGEIIAAIVDSLVIEKVDKARELANGGGTAKEKLAIFLRGSGTREAEPMMLGFLHHANNAFIHQKVLVQVVQQSVPYVMKILEQGAEEGTFTIRHLQETAEYILTGIHFMFDPGIFEWPEDALTHKRSAFMQIIERMLGDSFAFVPFV